MRTPIYLIIGCLFLGFAIAMWAGLLFPNLPRVGYLRLMIGLVLALMGAYRCLLAIFPPSDYSSRREGFRSRRKPQ